MYLEFSYVNTYAYVPIRIVILFIYRHHIGQLDTYIYQSLILKKYQFEIIVFKL